MVSELKISKMDRDQLTALLSAASYVEDAYRARVKYFIERLESRSAAFDYARQILDRVEPHFDGLAAFNAAFAGPAATIHAFWGADIAHLGSQQKWRVFRELVLANCPQPTLSAEERLNAMTRVKGETWLDFVDRYHAACVTTTASRENQVKTLYRKLPASLKKWLFSLPSTATVTDMTNALRHSSFWESSGQTRAEAEEDPMEIDMVAVQANAATDGRVIGNDGKINFAAITNAGRVMVGAREICKTSRREAQNMLRFLQRICGGSGRTEGQRRPQAQARRWGGPRAFMAEDQEPESSGEPVCETLSEGADEEEEQDLLRSHAAQSATKKETKKRVMKLGLVSQSHLGYPRKIDALVDTGSEASIMSLALAKELGAKVMRDETRLLLAHGKTAKVAGRCEVDVSLEKATQPSFRLRCLVLPNPGYELLMGIDAMTQNDMSVHPTSRTVRIKGRSIKCLFAGQKMDKEVTSEVVKNDDFGRLTERVDHLPALKGDRIQVPLNRSVVLGPKESRMVKTPIVIPRSVVHKRTPVVAPHFSVHLGIQYGAFSTLTLTNHREEPIRITGKTTIFEVQGEEGRGYTIRDCNGKQHPLRNTKQSFHKRQ